jgi:hypothetical protein
LAFSAKAWRESDVTVVGAAVAAGPVVAFPAASGELAVGSGGADVAVGSVVGVATVEHAASKNVQKIITMSDFQSILRPPLRQLRTLSGTKAMNSMDFFPVLLIVAKLLA